MGLLDDLRNQADSQREVEATDAEHQAERDTYYQETILPRMVKAYQFFNEFVKHLNYIKHETFVEYPLLPSGQLQRLQQTDYTIVIDSSKAIKEINFKMLCVMEKPREFELFGRDAVLSMADKIEQYSFRHERKNQKNRDMELESAKFILEGPLPLNVQILADVAEGKIRLALRNFNEPGFTKYILSPEQFDVPFLDRLGKFVIRQEKILFGGEGISDEAKKNLQDKVVVEKRLREEEMREAEARLKAEDEAEKQRPAKKQLKRAINTKVAKNKIKLKEMFHKLKVQAGFDKPS